MNWQKTVAMRYMAISMFTLFSVATLSGCVAESGETGAPVMISADAGNTGGNLCTSCSALTVNPNQGKVPCGVICSPSFTCRYDDEALNTFGDECFDVNASCKCVLKQELFCDDGVDEDLDGATDCKDNDCSKHVACVTGCGNSKVETGEDCDGGSNCLQTCKCPTDMVPDNKSGCVKVEEACGNGQVDLGEDCDGGSNCLQTCKCGSDMEPDNKGGCQTKVVCGNNKLETGEQCDGGSGCQKDCKCEAGKLPDNKGGCVDPPAVCGNNKVETGEDCDGGSNCLQGCKCPDGQGPDGSGGCKAGVCTPKCTGLVCGDDGCGGTCGTCKNGEVCKDDQTACLPQDVTPTKAEKCDNGVDDDGDGKVDSSDPECADKIVAVLGIYFGSPCTLHIKSGDGEAWDGNIPGNFTLSIKIDGSDKNAKIWVENCSSVSAKNPHGFNVWEGDHAVKYPNWPKSSVQPLFLTEFSRTPSSPSTFNFYLEGAK